MPTPSTIIAGGGVIGLSLALELQQRGRRVVVLERDHCGDTANGAATPASAGILGVNDPHNPPQMQPLADLSYSLYAEFLERLEALSGRGIVFDTTHALEAFVGGMSAKGETPINRSPGELLTVDQLRELEPDLVAGDAEWYRREEPCLDPRLLCAALLAACRAVGVDVRENEPVMSMTCGIGEISLHTPTGIYSGEQFCLAAGAWSGGLFGGEPCGVADFSAMVPTVPRRGQMLALSSPQHPIRHTVRAPEVYLVPRPDGRVLSGSTVEFAGFEVATQAHIMDELHAGAAQAYPSLAVSQRLEQWAGLRPGTPDDLPILGALPQEGCFVATGHFRNGILLAPGTAQVIADLMEGREPGVSIAAFAPTRFAER